MASLMPLTIVLVWAFALPVRGRLEMILRVPAFAGATTFESCAAANRTEQAPKIEMMTAEFFILHSPNEC